MVPTKNLLCPLRLLLIIPPLKSNFPGLLPKFLFLFIRARTLPSRVRSARLCLASVLGSLRSALPCFRPRFTPLGSALLPSSVRSARLCLASVLGSLRSALPCFRPRLAPLGSALLPPSARSARLHLASALGSLCSAPPCFRPRLAPLGSALLPSLVRSARLRLASAPLRPFARRLLTHFHTRSLAHARTQNNYMHNNLTTDLLLSPFPLTTVIPQPFPFNLSIFPLSPPLSPPSPSHFPFGDGAKM